MAESVSFLRLKSFWWSCRGVSPAVSSGWLMKIRYNHQWLKLPLFKEVFLGKEEILGKEVNKVQCGHHRPRR